MAQTGTLLAGFALTISPHAFALNPALEISQYAHQGWTIRDGFIQSSIYAITQTPDGYLVLGTYTGLARFDGVRALPWEPPAGPSLPSEEVYSLLTGRDGRLWIGTLKGLASWRDGQSIQYPELAGIPVYALAEDDDGIVWAGTIDAQGKGRLCSVRGNAVQCHGQDGSLGPGVYSLYVEKGNLWVRTFAGVWRWKPGPPKLISMPALGPDGPQGISEDDGVLISTLRGLRRLRGEKVEIYPVPEGTPTDQLGTFRDRDGGLWVGTLSHGLIHFHQGKADQFARADGLSGNTILTFFEDKEGNVWVATSAGLDKFRDLSVTTVSEKQGLSSDSAWSILSSMDGSVWIGTRDGLNRWKDGQVTVYGKGNRVEDDASSIFEDSHGRLWTARLSGVGYLQNGRFVPVHSLPGGQPVRSIAEDTGGNLYFSYFDQLVTLEKAGTVRKTPWAQMGRKVVANVLIPDPVRGGIWLGFVFDNGIAHFKEGQIDASYMPADGVGKGSVGDLQLDRDGTLWASTENGLSRVKDGRVATLNSASGLPCDSVQWMREDDEHSVWLLMGCGLVRMARSELDAWSHDTKRKIQTAALDSTYVYTGVTLVSGYSPRIAKAGGKFWFLGNESVSMLDPRHLVFNSVQPPVQIEQVKADGKSYNAAGGLRLPALVRNVLIDYTALSLAAPEKVRFKYKLEGQDRDWTEVVNKREVQYTNLGPHSYRFQVLAANNSGIWSDAGASLDFSIAPAYYQTDWFRVSLAAIFLGLIWAAYQYRLSQIRRAFDARIEERTRIAEELHDTVVQAIAGSTMLVENAAERIPESMPVVKGGLLRVLDGLDAALVQSRAALKGLRATRDFENDLAKQLSDAANDAEERGITFKLAITGESRALRQPIHYEVFRIGAEAIGNALKHSGANTLWVELGYADGLRMVVRDNGKGIPEELLASGLPGHFGLEGMRGRAERIGASLEVSSRFGVGTEVSLTIPSHLAFENGASRPSFLPRVRSRIERR
jgi:signal transduction histidine kinase/ligand-binding sensor domain-containing protein